MKVYVLEDDMGYDGCTVVGVFATLEAARASQDVAWEEVTGGVGDGCVVAKQTRRPSYASVYVIREFEVLGTVKP